MRGGASLVKATVREEEEVGWVSAVAIKEVGVLGFRGFRGVVRGLRGVRGVRAASLSPPREGEADLQKVKETNIRALNPCPHRPL